MKQLIMTSVTASDDDQSRDFNRPDMEETQQQQQPALTHLTIDIYALNVHVLVRTAAYRWRCAAAASPLRGCDCSTLIFHERAQLARRHRTRWAGGRKQEGATPSDFRPALGLSPRVGTVIPDRSVPTGW